MPGSVLRPASFRRVRYSASGTSERRAPSVTSSAVKPWMWMRSDAGAHRLEHVEVVVAVEVGVDAALEAHLGGALGLGLGHAARDLVELEQVGRAAQVQRERALGEGAEAALEGADVGVVDVAVAHVGDGVADRRPAQVVGDLGHHLHLGAPGAEERHDLRRARPPGPSATPARTSATAPPRPGRRPAAPWRVEQRRRGRLAARAPRGVAGQALGVGGVEHGEAQRRVEPALGVVGERRGRR